MAGLTLVGPRPFCLSRCSTGCVGAELGIVGHAVAPSVAQLQQRGLARKLMLSESRSSSSFQRSSQLRFWFLFPPMRLLEQTAAYCRRADWRHHGGGSCWMYELQQEPLYERPSCGAAELLITPTSLCRRHLGEAWPTQQAHKSLMVPGESGADFARTRASR